MIALTLEMMQRRWPHGNQHVPGLIEGIVAAAPIVFPKYGLDAAMAMAHAMAQFSEECGQGLEMIESLNYTAKGLRKEWPTHFTPSMALRWEHNERMIGAIAYGGRMGNAPYPSFDGYNFRGQGLSQVTGREGVENLQRTLNAHDAGFNVVEKPELICSPQYALECGVADWIACKCLPPALADDLLLETERLNGGTTGLDERARQLGLWKTEFGLH